MAFRNQRSLNGNPICATDVTPVSMFYRRLLLVVSLLIAALPSSSHAQHAILDGREYAHYIAQFNGLDTSQTATLIPNAKAWQWTLANVPVLSCPDKDLEETYYFRWWTFRKYIRRTPDGWMHFLAALVGAP